MASILICAGIGRTQSLESSTPSGVRTVQGSPVNSEIVHRDARYRLCASDIIAVAFPLTPEFDQTVDIEPDGFAAFAGAGSLHLEGMTTDEAAAAIRSAYAKTLRDPIVTIDLKDFNKPYFVISGQVNRPGKYDLRGDLSASQAVAEAGGFNNAAKHSQVLLFRRINEQWYQVRSLDLKRILAGHGLDEDAELQSGDMLYDGARFQWITICQSLREPVTKALLAKSAGLAYTGLYDMAARLVVTLRELIVQSNQVLIPTISNLHERDRAAIPVIYRESYRLVFFLAVPAFAILVVSAPLVSTLWIGSYQSLFVRFVALLAMAWLVNVLCNPAYVIDLGTGDLRWVSIGCTVTAVLNAGLGFLAGTFCGGTAIVATACGSLIVGYLIMLTAYHRQAHEPFGILLPRESRVIFALSVTGALVILGVLYSSAAAAGIPSAAFASAVLALALLVAFPVWTHPIRRRLVQWLTSGMPS